MWWLLHHRRPCAVQFCDLQLLHNGYDLGAAFACKCYAAGDGAFLRAAVYMDEHGHLLTGMATPSKASSALAAEAQALRQAMNLARNFSLSKIIFESDCANLKQAIKSSSKIAKIDIILDDIGDLRREIPDCGFTWVPRDGNRLAHEVAKLAAVGSLNLSWCSRRPFSVNQILQAGASPSS
ncbi:hypothetical protein PIB30_021077 [Stylosanthes scabra]|uniref:RNase H type-1 domain-containing protein n=1 Tax=Stylosanthes scabra TaxID=79078 RepID=A0ABU6X7J5_9FABA|nr:hypothetical protein [Stylosanthes scabra]